MLNRRRVLAFTFLVVFAAGPIYAQEPARPATTNAAASAVVEVRLTDGSVLFGTVVSETPASIVIQTVSGVVVTLARQQITSLEPASGAVVDGEFRRADANATRLLFAPTGRTLAKGEGYVGVFEVLLPFVQVGVTDTFSMGAGTPLVFFGDESSRPVWLTPKLQVYHQGRTSASIGVMHFVVFGEDVRMGMAYGVVTRGTADNAWTAGASWAYARYRETEYTGNCYGPPNASMVPCVSERVTKTPGSPVVMFGGERRISRRVKLLSENYGFKAGGIVSVGVRFLGERLSADLGVFAPIVDEDVFVLLPVVNFVWTFGTRRAD